LNYYASSPLYADGYVFFVSDNNIHKYNLDQRTCEIVFFGHDFISDVVYSENRLFFSYLDDLYQISIQNNELTRLTYLQATSKPIFVQDEELYFLSSKDAVFHSSYFLFSYNLVSKQIRDLKKGPINWMYPDGNDNYYQINEYGYLFWKEYKGGTAGRIYKNSSLLVDLPNNCLKPFVYEGRVYFIYDDSKCNIYSCLKDGSDIKQETFHEDFQIEGLYLNQGQITYSKLGEIFILDIKSGKDQKINLQSIVVHYDFKQDLSEHKKFLTSVDVNDNEIIFAFKGNVFQGGVYSGGMRQLNDSLRFIHAGFLSEKRSFGIKDGAICEIHVFENKKLVDIIELAPQKIVDVISSEDCIFFSNHKHELWMINLKDKSSLKIDATTQEYQGMALSYDARWLCYSKRYTQNANQLILYDIENKQSRILTSGFDDYKPVFDVEGEFIAFISNRVAKTVNDDYRFNKMLSNSEQIYLIPLQKGKNFQTPWNEKENAEDEKVEKPEVADKAESKAEKEAKEKLEIDFENITSRIIKLPAKGGAKAIYSISDSKILYETTENSKPCVKSFSLKTLSEEVLHDHYKEFYLSSDAEHAILFDEEFEFKIAKAGQKCEETGYHSKNFDWERLQSKITQKQEFENMFDELCFLNSEFYWSDKHAGLDLKAVKEKYKKHLCRINTTEELFTLFDQLQGELGTSHAFIYGNGLPPQNDTGRLGAQFEWSEESQKFAIKKILDSDFRSSQLNPLLEANAGIAEGNLIISVDGVEANLDNPIEKLLAHKANKWIDLEINDKIVEVKPLISQKALRYRTWVNDNQNFVEASDPDVGYVHIRDMGGKGFQDFFTSYMSLLGKKAIIIDVRYNTGGNISTLILDYLLRKKEGIDINRHGDPYSIPFEASCGNLVLLVNENTASDGEIFAHRFKYNKLGPLVGKRTWGGVVGISPRFSLVDGTLTSQPEFATWFKDIGLKLENHGVEPDYLIENNFEEEYSPENDLQLQKAIELAGAAVVEDLLSQAKNSPLHPVRS
jgi:tricorn protease